MWPKAVKLGPEVGNDVPETIKFGPEADQELDEEEE